MSTHSLVSKSFYATSVAAALIIPLLGAAQVPTGAAHAQLKQLVDADSAEYVATSKTIWDFAEMGYLEQKSSALLQQDLKKAGFKVESGVAGEPTAFIASYGQGSPVIAILGEFDALPGLSQEAGSPQHKPLVMGAPGHGCGHNLLGSGAALAATALKQYMQANRIQGTLRYYGSPAEEGGSGKVFMVRAGLFKDVDVALTWHPKMPTRYQAAVRWRLCMPNSISTVSLHTQPEHQNAVDPRWTASC